MKIEYRQVGSASGYTTLIDTSNGDTIEPWEPSYRQNLQIDNLAGNTTVGGSVKIKQQGNIECTLSMRNVAVTYVSAQAALAATRTVPTALLNSLVNIKVTQGTEVQYFPSASCGHIRPSLQGCTVVYNIDFVSKMVTAVEPA